MRQSDDGLLSPVRQTMLSVPRLVWLILQSPEDLWLLVQFAAVWADSAGGQDRVPQADNRG